MVRKRRLLLDCTSAAKTKRGGIQNYIVNLALSLRELETEFDVVIGLRVSHFRERKLLLDLAPQGAELLVPYWRRGAAIIHGLGVRLLPYGRSVPQVVTVHDVGVFDVPHLFKPSWVASRTQRTRQVLRRADAVVVLTEHTKGRFRHFFPDFAGPIKVAPLAVDHAVYRAEPEEDDRQVLAGLGITGPYLLQVGALAPRKDPETTIRAFARLKRRDDYQLVLPGKTKPEALAQLMELARTEGVESRIVCPGFVPEEALPRLYRHTSAFVFASQYEGFGLPIVESMACGAPVIVSASSCLPEVAGDAARVFTPGDADELARELESILENPEEASRLKERAIARSKTFTWRRTAEKSLEVYREVLG